MGWLIHSGRNINRLVQLLQHSSHCCAIEASESEPRGPSALQFLIWHVLYVSLTAHAAMRAALSLQSAAWHTLVSRVGKSRRAEVMCQSPTFSSVGHLLNPWQFRRYVCSVLWCSFNMPFFQRDTLESESWLCSLKNSGVFGIVRQQHRMILFSELFFSITQTYSCSLRPVF